jgi:hypothetical protein
MWFLHLTRRIDPPDLTMANGPAHSGVYRRGLVDRDAVPNTGMPAMTRLDLNHPRLHALHREPGEPARFISIVVCSASPQTAFDTTDTWNCANTFEPRLASLFRSRKGKGGS